jgi:hypothetical protein
MTREGLDLSRQIDHFTLLEDKVRNIVERSGMDEIRELRAEVGTERA